MKLPQSKFDPKRWAIVGAAIALIVGLVACSSERTGACTSACTSD